MTLAGSRSLSSAEGRYAAIEGEALAVAWGLEQTKYFTQGCDNLVIVTDHKPLVKIFGDRTLDEITNSRLFRFKQRTLPWKFEIQHLPGTSNTAADAASRHPASSGATGPNMADLMEATLMAAVHRDVEGLDAIAWVEISREMAADPTLSRLMQLIEHGFHESDKSDNDLAQFWPLREALYIQDGVILYQDRVVVPATLRRRILSHLHSAHQGIALMGQRARAIINTGPE